MPGMDSIFSKIGESLGVKPKAAATSTAHPSARAGIKSKPFDINIYFQAVGLFFSDFFGKKVPYFFKNMGPVMNKFPGWWNKLPQDEQISYGGVLLGFVLILVGAVLFVVL